MSRLDYVLPGQKPPKTGVLAIGLIFNFTYSVQAICDFRLNATCVCMRICFNISLYMFQCMFPGIICMSGNTCRVCVSKSL